MESMLHALVGMHGLAGWILALTSGLQHGADVARLRATDLAGTSKLALAVDKSQVKLHVTPQELARYDFVVPQASGNALDVRSRVRAEGTSATLEVRPKETVFIRPKAVESLDPSKGRVYSNGRMLFGTEGATPGESKTSSYRTLFNFENSKLVWSKTDGAYSTRLFVSIEPEDASSTKAPDKLAVVFTFSLDGADVRVEPNPLTVTHISTPLEVRLLCARHEAIPKVTAKSYYGDSEASFTIVPSLLLSVTSSSKEILGFGLEAATLRVERMAEDSRPWPDARPIKVMFSPDRGTVEPSEVSIGANESASVPVVFRASGIGSVAVTAAADGVVSEGRVVVLTWPIALTACGLIGGAIGGLIRFYEQKKRSRGKGMPKWIPAALIGAIVGVTLVIAAALGIQSLPVAAIAYSEAGAALIGVLAGYTGTRLLGSLADSMFGAKAATKDA